MLGSLNDLEQQHGVMFVPAALTGDMSRCGLPVQRTRSTGPPATCQRVALLQPLFREFHENRLNYLSSA